MLLLHAQIKANRHQVLLDQHLPSFPLSFQQKIGRYRRWQDAQASLLGRLLLRHGLVDHFGLRLDFGQLQYTDLGKPYWPNTEVAFNISHSGSRVVCGFQRARTVGVDIEQMKPTELADFRSQMTDGEWSLVSQSEDVVSAFYDYWTSKEAILKILGSGLSLGLKTFEVAEDRRTATVKEKTWHLQKCVLAADYCCYVATELPLKNRPKVLEISF